MTTREDLKVLRFKDTMAQAGLTMKDLADRRAAARELLDEWLEVTGAISEGGSWYYELCSIIEDAVEIGMLGETIKEPE